MWLWINGTASPVTTAATSQMKKAVIIAKVAITQYAMNVSVIAAVVMNHRAGDACQIVHFVMIPSVKAV